MTPRQRPKLVVVLVGVLGLIGILLLAGSPVRASFTASTGSPNNFLAASADFNTGAMYTWGGQIQTTPRQVGSSTAWTQIATGTVSDCGIRSPGTLWCSGRNAAGQLGLGDTTNRATPTQVGTATTWVSVDVGDAHACGLRADGTIWCWGANNEGQIGNGNYDQQNSPVQLTSPSPTGWSQLSVGWNTNCAVRNDTSLYCWGSNVYGQIGDGGPSTRTSPVAVTVPSATGWTIMTAGDRVMCALRTGNTLYCWGIGDSGQLGQGNTASSTIPVQVPGTSWASMGLDRYTVCGIKTDRSLWCWGVNTEGEAGVGTNANVLSPTQVGSGTNWQKVAGGQFHTCATQTDSTLWCWGANNAGQVGDSTTTYRNVPVPVTSPVSTGWALTTMGVSADRSCAGRSDGTLWCWGQAYRNAYAPALFDATVSWHKPVNGVEYTCALRTSGTLFCWGLNDNGQLGDDTTTTRPTPTQVGTSSSWTTLAAGMRHTCGIRSDGTLWCWGYNINGQLGVGSTTQQNSPTQVTSPAPNGWSQVWAGNASTCATRTDGSLYCWGYGGTGGLGNGTTANVQTTPTAVTNPTTNAWTTLSIGYNFACGIQSTALYCWGANDYGSLGNGNGGQQSTPTQVSGNWTGVGAGWYHACATRTTGSLWCWGAAGEGQLGTGVGAGNAFSPTQVGSATSWSTVTAGDYFTCGTQTDRTVWCWGQNTVGQLGINDITDRATPQQLAGTTGRLVQAGSMSSSVTLIQPPAP